MHIRTTVSETHRIDDTEQRRDLRIPAQYAANGACFLAEYLTEILALVDGTETYRVTAGGPMLTSTGAAHPRNRGSRTWEYPVPPDQPKPATIGGQPGWTSHYLLGPDTLRAALTCTAADPRVPPAAR